jgi:hypothetical protein
VIAAVPSPVKKRTAFATSSGWTSIARGACSRLAATSCGATSSRSGDQTWGNGVHADAERPEFDSGVSGERGQRCLGGVVCGHTCSRLECSDRGDVDDRTAGISERLDGPLDDRERGLDIEPEDVPQHRGFGVADRRLRVDAGGVKDAVEATEEIKGLADHPMISVVGGQIGWMTRLRTRAGRSTGTPP